MFPAVIAKPLAHCGTQGTPDIHLAAVLSFLLIFGCMYLRQLTYRCQDVIAVVNATG